MGFVQDFFVELGLQILKSLLVKVVFPFLQAPGDPDHLDMFISIHSTPDFKSGVEPDAREVNIVYHLWVFQSVEMLGDQAQYLQQTVEMGLFQPYNIAEVGQDVCEGSEELDGISVNRLGPRVVEIVSFLCVVMV